MNYYFTGALIILFVLLCFIKPAYPRNEYLNNGTNTCSTGDLAYQSNTETRSLGIDTLILTIIIIALLMIGPYV